MNRKAELGWSLETIGKMVFYALILLALIYMSYQLISLFVSGSQDVTAKRNLDILHQRIDLSKRTSKTENSVILSLPDGYFLRNFAADDVTQDMKTYCSTVFTRLWEKVGVSPDKLTTYDPKTGKDVSIMKSFKLTRPSMCPKNGGCICLYVSRGCGDTVDTAYEAISCFDSTFDQKYRYEVDGVDADGEHPDVNSGVQNAKIIPTGVTRTQARLLE